VVGSSSVGDILQGGAMTTTKSGIEAGMGCTDLVLVLSVGVKASFLNHIVIERPDACLTKCTFDCCF
jgi:hypothetical protein